MFVFSPKNSDAFRVMLQFLVSKNKLPVYFDYKEIEGPLFFVQDHVGEIWH